MTKDDKENRIGIDTRGHAYIISASSSICSKYNRYRLLCAYCI